MHPASLEWMGYFKAHLLVYFFLFVVLVLPFFFFSFILLVPLFFLDDHFGKDETYIVGKKKNFCQVFRSVGQWD